MEKFIIEGGHHLSGTIRPAGNKNAALPLLAACLLSEETITFHNMPQIGDVHTMLAILDDLGVTVNTDRWRGEGVVSLTAAEIRKSEPNPTLARKIRASLVLMGPMLARLGQVKMGHPGGDPIGSRPVDTHFQALGALGAAWEVGRTTYTLSAAQGLHGADIFLVQASVTGTENAIMAAVLAAGRTTILNAASEPHVQELCHFLNKLGAQITGVGSNQLTIDGVARLSGGEHTIESDYIEVGSYIGLAAITGSELLIKDAVPQHMRMTRLMFERLGVRSEVRGGDLFVPGGQQLRVSYDVHGGVAYIDDAPWPGFPADVMSIALTVATQAEGTILIFEKMFDARLFFVDKLNSMGARIILCDPHRAVVIGPARLHGEELSSPDIRAGMALLLAALSAEGTSTIFNVQQIDRGYERIEERLQALGARIERQPVAD